MDEQLILRILADFSGTNQSIADFSAKLQAASAKNVAAAQKGTKAWKANADVLKKNLGVSSERAAKDLDRLTAALKKNRTAATSAGKAAKNAGKGFGGLGRIMKRAAIALGLASITQAVIRFGRQSVKTFREFDQQLSTVAAVLGTTVDGIEDLEKQALKLGRTTRFTTKEVLQLQTALAKLGFEQEEILASTAGILDLSVATQESLARSAEVVGSTLRQFGLNADQTGRVVDVMTKAFTSSALNLERFQVAMRNVAPVAARFGLSIEETVPFLQLLANKGLEASQIGTSLRKIFLNLADSSGDLNIALGGNVNSFKELVDGLENINKSFPDSATAANKLSAALKLTDVRSVTAFSAILDGIPTLKAFKAGLEDATDASRQAAIVQDDNLNGAFLRSKSAIEGFQIAMLDGNGTLRSAVEGWADLVNTVTDYIRLSPEEEITREKFELIQLTEEARNTNDTYADRAELIAKLQRAYPSYFEGLDIETTKLSKILEILGLINVELGSGAGRRFEESQIKVIDKNIENVTKSLTKRLNEAQKLIEKAIEEARSKGKNANLTGDIPNQLRGIIDFKKSIGKGAGNNNAGAINETADAIERLKGELVDLNKERVLANNALTDTLSRLGTEIEQTNALIAIKRTEIEETKRLLGLAENDTALENLNTRLGVQQRELEALKGIRKEAQGVSDDLVAGAESLVQMEADLKILNDKIRNAPRDTITDTQLAVRDALAAEVLELKIKLGFATRKKGSTSVDPVEVLKEEIRILKEKIAQNSGGVSFDGDFDITIPAGILLAEKLTALERAKLGKIAGGIEEELERELKRLQDKAIKDIGDEEFVNTDAVNKAVLENFRFTQELSKLNAEQLAKDDEEFLATFDQFNRDIEIAELKHQLALIQIEIDFGELSLKNLKKKKELELRIRKATLDGFDEDETDAEAKEAEQLAKFQERAQGVLQVLGGLFALQNQIEESNHQRRLERLDELRDKELENAGDNATRKEAIEATYQKQVEQLELEAARRRKAIAVKEAVIGIASALIQALDNPFQFALAAALGAIQLAIIQSTEFMFGGVLNDLSETMGKTYQKAVDGMVVMEGGSIPDSGGIMKGRRHSRNGIRALFNGRPIEAEDGEGYIRNGSDRYILNRNSMADPFLKSLASWINVQGGGVQFAKHEQGAALQTYSINSDFLKFRLGADVNRAVSKSTNPNDALSANVLLNLNSTLSKLVVAVENMPDTIELSKVEREIERKQLDATPTIGQ